MSNQKSSAYSKRTSPLNLPPPGGASDVLREALSDSPEIIAESLKLAEKVPQTDEEWLAFIAADDELKQTEVQVAIDQSPVSVKHDEIEGVNVYHVIPDEIDPKHEDHLFVHVHGGAYVFNGGLARLVWQKPS